MRSRPYKEYATPRERIVGERLQKLHGKWRRPRRISCFMDGRVLTGWASGHRSAPARRWRTVMRIMARLKTRWPG